MCVCVCVGGNCSFAFLFQSVKESRSCFVYIFFFFFLSFFLKNSIRKPWSIKLSSLPVCVYSMWSCSYDYGVINSPNRSHSWAAIGTVIGACTLFLACHMDVGGAGDFRRFNRFLVNGAEFEFGFAITFNYLVRVKS